MEMRYFWLCGKIAIAQDAYSVKWHPDQENLANYQSKHHLGPHHQAVRPWYQHEENSHLGLPQATLPSTLKGCDGTLLEGYPHNVPHVLLEEQAGVHYRANPGGWKDPIQCPYPGCPGMLSTPYMLRRHFWDLHPKDKVEILREGSFQQCERCMMQCNQRYPWHIHTQVCFLGAEQWTQRDSAVTAALALCKLFHVEEELPEKVDSFQYLGRILAQDDDDVRAVRQQIKETQGIWARVGQVLMAANTLPKVSAKIYKAVMQSVLLYGSKTWNLTTTALAWLEGFHIRKAYWVAKKHKPKKGLHHRWVYPRSSDVLQECSMATILHSINVRRATIF
jgi:hypothetical protein